MTDYSVVVLARGLRMRSGRDVPSTGNSDLLLHFGAEEEKHDYVLITSKTRFYNVPAAAKVFLALKQN